jgi:hypothetical protein
VLALDAEIADIDSAHWANWYSLLVPPRLRAGAGWALLILYRGALIKVVVQGRGAIDVDQVPYRGADRLLPVARALGVGAVIVIEREVIAAIHAEVERELDMGADFVAQALVIVRAIRRRAGKGIWSEPELLELVPPLSYDGLQRTFDMLVPDRTSMATYVFEDDGSDVHASIIAVKRRAHIDLVTTHLALGEALDGRALARDWRRRHRDLVKLVAERFEKPVLGLFLERSAFYRIAAGPSDQLARELGARNVIIEPAPAWLLGLLGGATMAAFAGRGARALARMLPRSARQMASDLAHSAQSAMRERGAHPFALLGFDPIELWLRVRHLYH